MPKRDVPIENPASLNPSLVTFFLSVLTRRRASPTVMLRPFWDLRPRGPQRGAKLVDRPVVQLGQ